MRTPRILHFITLNLIYDYNMTQNRTTDLVCHTLHAPTSNHRRTSKISSSAGKWGCLMTSYSSLGLRRIGSRQNKLPVEQSGHNSRKFWQFYVSTVT